jgi:tetratricopeptide (TPR) repeat protein
MPSHEILNAQTARRATVSQDRVLEQRAATLARLGRTKEAVELYMQALQKNPRNSNLYYRLAELLPGKENAPTLIEIVDALLERQTNNQNLQAEKGRLLYVLGKKAEAKVTWEAIVKAKKAEHYTYTTVTNAMLKAGATDEAIALLTNGRAVFGNQTVFAYDLARIYAVKHDYALASKEYLLHLQRNPRMLDHITTQLIRLLENDGALVLIESSFDEILARQGDHNPILLSRAKLLLHEKSYDACVQSVLNLDKSKSMKDVFSIAGDLEGDKAWRHAAELYLFVSAESHDARQKGEALLKLANTYEQRIKKEADYPSLAGYFPGNIFFELDLNFMPEEDQHLERTLRLYDSLETILPKTRSAFQASFQIAEINLTTRGDVDRAIQGFRTIFEKAPHQDLKLAAGKRLVDAWLAKGDTTEAIQNLDKVLRVLSMDRDDPTIIASRVKILIHKGDVSKLIQELRNLSGAALPSNPLFNDGLELQTLLEGNGGESDVQLLEYLKAEQLIGQHKLTQAIDLLQQIEGASTSIADESAVRAIQLLLVLDEQERASSAMDMFLRTQLESDLRATVLIWKGEQLQYVDKDPLAAIPFYEELIISHPDYLGIQAVRLRLREILGVGS